MFLLKLFSSRGIIPGVVRKGSQIVLLVIDEFQLRFLSSNTYVDGNELELCKHFNLLFSEVYFPQLFVSTSNLTYEGQIPNFDFFLESNDDEKLISQKMAYYRIHCLAIWNLRDQLIKFASNSLEILFKSMMIFLEECFALQALIIKKAEEKKEIFINPFNSPICTIGGFIYTVYRFFYLNYYNMFVVKNEHGKCGKNVSRIEHQYLSFIRFLNPSKEYVSQFYFRESVVDFFCPEEGKAYFVHGCFWHSCLDPSCNVNKNRTPDSLNYQGKTFQSVQEEFDLKIHKLMQNNPSVKQIDVIWECVIKRKMKEPAFASFLKDHYVLDPLEPLIPRKCYRGALIDNYRLRWSKLRCPGESFFYYDVNGMYSHIALTRQFMIGKYEILVGPSISKRLKLSGTTFLIDDVEVMGAAQVTILPPNTCLYPFLMYRAKNNKVYNTLCKLCCENDCKICLHSDEKRALIGCYLLSELSYAISLGYRLIHVHEIHFYKNFDYILRDFVKILSSLKTRHSNLWANCHTNDEKTLYCSYLNQTMNLSGDLAITVNDQYNPSKRYFQKLCQNSLFGKFGQKNDFSRTVFVTEQSQIDSLMNGKDPINDVFCISPNLCLLEVGRNPKLLPPNRNGNCYISAQITAFSRQFIHEKLMLLARNPDCKLISVDCDSIMFTLPTQSTPNLRLSDAVGDFKNEINGDVLNYFSLGPKNYSLVYESNGTTQSIRKISGLSLSQETDINAEMYESFLDSYAQNIFKSKTVLTSRRKADFTNLSLTTEQSKYTLTNVVAARRHVDKSSPELITLPYGFKK